MVEGEYREVIKQFGDAFSNEEAGAWREVEGGARSEGGGGATANVTGELGR